MRHSAIFVVIAVLCLCSPARIHAQSPNSYGYILQADQFAKSKDSAVQLLTNCDRDWIILDPAYESGADWETTDLKKIRAGKAGRKIIAYISIGEAEEYRAYWKKDWGSDGKLTKQAPDWLLAVNPNWEGNYRVKYWKPEWQKIALDLVDKALKKGFDGVFLDIVDAFEGFEQDGNDYIDNRINPETKQSYRRDMVDWVSLIAKHARSIKPDALVVPQNGSQLVTHSDFLDLISGYALEDLFTDGNQIQSKSHTKYVLGFVKKVLDKKKPVLLTEYAAKKNLITISQQQAKANNLVLLLTDRDLTELGKSQK